MTISSEVRKSGPYPGNGVADTFPFDFKIFEPEDLLVVLTIDGAEQDLEFGDDYGVSLNSDQENSPGGEVVLNTPLPSGQLLTMTSAAKNLQPTKITNQGAFYPEVVNQAFDRVTILIQQVDEKVGRSVKVPISSTVTPDDLIDQLTSDAASAREAAQNASQTLTDIERTIQSAEQSIDQKVADADSYAQAAAQSAADAENRVPMSGPTGAGYLPEGTDAQRPAPEDIPEGVAAVRGNSTSLTDYFLELFNRKTEVWDALASRGWVTSAINAAKTAIENWVNGLIGFAVIYPNGGTAASPATITANTRYISANPFPNCHVICEVEVLINGEWGNPGWDGNAGSGGNAYGTRSSQISLSATAPGAVVVQTGANGVAHGRSELTGGVHTSSGNAGIVSAPARVKIWSVKGSVA